MNELRRWAEDWNPVGELIALGEGQRDIDSSDGVLLPIVQTCRHTEKSRGGETRRRAVSGMAAALVARQIERAGADARGPGLSSGRGRS